MKRKVSARKIEAVELHQIIGKGYYIKVILDNMKTAKSKIFSSRIECRIRYQKFMEAKNAN